jgi:hypothetical protein
LFPFILAARRRSAGYPTRRIGDGGRAGDRGLKSAPHRQQQYAGSDGDVDDHRTDDADGDPGTALSHVAVMLLLTTVVASEAAAFRHPATAIRKRIRCGHIGSPQRLQMRFDIAPEPPGDGDHLVEAARV